MASVDELLAKLEERFILGEIDRGTYEDVRARLMARRQTPGEPAPGAGASIADSVIKGNVSNVSGRASVGSVIVNFPGEGPGGIRGSRAEVEYEQFVLTILRAGGRLEVARAELDARRTALGISLRLAEQIEVACRRAACPGPPPVPDEGAARRAGPARLGAGPGERAPDTGMGVVLRISYPGEWMLMDLSATVCFDGLLLGKGSITNGFEFEVQTTAGIHELSVKPPLRMAKTYRLNLPQPGSYALRLGYSYLWGHFEDQFELTRSE